MESKAAPVEAPQPPEAVEEPAPNEASVPEAVLEILPEVQTPMEAHRFIDVLNDCSF